MTRIERYTHLNNFKESFAFNACLLAAALIFFMFLSIVLYVFWRGMPEAFSLNYLFSAPEGGRNDGGGVSYPLLGTIYIVLASLALSAPIGVFAAVQLTEYANPKSPFTQLARFSIQSLAGIPSVIYGLFGLIFFVSLLGFKHSLLAGSFSLAIMILPFVIRATEESILAVPNSLRQASLAIGATKVQTILKIVLPAASPGIFTGIMLGIGRAIAESAVLILATGGSITVLPRLISGEYPFLLADSGRTLSVHLYYQATSYDSTGKAFATSAILIMLICLINVLTWAFFQKKIKNRGN